MFTVWRKVGFLCCSLLTLMISGCETDPAEIDLNGRWVLDEENSPHFTYLVEDMIYNAEEVRALLPELSDRQRERLLDKFPARIWIRETDAQGKTKLAVASEDVVRKVVKEHFKKRYDDYLLQELRIDDGKFRIQPYKYPGGRFWDCEVVSVNTPEGLQCTRQDKGRERQYLNGLLEVSGNSDRSAKISLLLYIDRALTYKRP